MHWFYHRKGSRRRTKIDYIGSVEAQSTEPFGFCLQTGFPDEYSFAQRVPVESDRRPPEGNVKQVKAR